MPKPCGRAIFAAVCALTAIVAGCGGEARQPRSAPAELLGTVTIFAAASLTDAFNDLAREFTKANPAVDIKLNFGGSPTLRAQLEQGARADIFASADQRQMDFAYEGGIVRSMGTVFALNSLVVITPVSNPGRIYRPGDLQRPRLKIVLANEDVPVGAYSRQMLGAMEKDPAYGAGFRDAVLKNVVSLESNVKQVVAKVELGEADAGVVYGSDVTPALAGKLNVITIPPRFNVIAAYPVALTREASNPRAAQAFIDFVLCPQGQAVLEKYGFQPVS